MATQNLEADDALENEDEVLELGTDDTPQLDDDGNPIEPIDDEPFPDTFDEDGEVKNPHLVAQLREEVARRAANERELERRLAQPRIVRTPKPDLDSFWGEGDPQAAFESAFLAWKDNEAAADAQERAPAPAATDQAKAWQTDLQAYKTEGAKLGETFKASEDKVIASLNDAQQSTIVMAAKHPARFINALGRSPNRLAALSLITNPIKLAAEVARIEGKSVMPRRDPPNIDTPARGSARLSANVDQEEARLEKEADRTGERSKLVAYRSAKRKASK